MRRSAADMLRRARRTSRTRRTRRTTRTRRTSRTRRTQISLRAFRHPRKKYRPGEHQELVHEGQGIRNHHVQEEQGAANAEDGARAEPRDEWLKDARHNQAHDSSVPRLA